MGIITTILKKKVLLVVITKDKRTQRRLNKP